MKLLKIYPTFIVMVHENPIDCNAPLTLYTHGKQAIEDWP